MNTCTKCLEDRDLDGFSPGRGRFGRQSWCKRCVAAYSRDYYAKNRERVLKRQGDYRVAHPSKARLEHKWYRGATLQRLYGLTEADYDRMLQAQGGVCFLCGRPPKKQRLAVDHDHRTGEVRRLLCNRCNTALGWFESSPDFARKVLDYTNVLDLA